MILLVYMFSHKNLLQLDASTVGLVKNLDFFASQLTTVYCLNRRAHADESKSVSHVQLFATLWL